MNRKLEGRNALITGGSRGIGAAIALAFAVEGANIAICHNDDDEGAAAVASAVAARGGGIFTARCDVGDPHALIGFVAAAAGAIGPIDIAVSNAGMGGDRPFADIDLATFDRMIDVHLRALFVLSQGVLPGMRARRWGRIIAISSQLAYKGGPGLVHYCAAKAGMTGFVRALAQEVAAEGVLVNAIAPGPIDTRLAADLSEEWKAFKRAQLPIGRFGQPDEIAPTAVLLASGDGSYYVGQTLSPNGGDVML
jgi:3-oxoacyl-[acyl-carrier protein] reductase